MRNGSFVRGAAVGFVCAVLGGAAVAWAGTGVGGVFNLGKNNTVNATSGLRGSTSGAQLSVANTSTTSSATAISAAAAGDAPALKGSNTATGAGVTGLSASGIGVLGEALGASQPAVAALNTAGGPAALFHTTGGAAPFTVNSSTKVTNLNADELDGLDGASLQHRVTGTCTSGAMTSIASDGTVACAAAAVVQVGSDTDTDVGNTSATSTPVFVGHTVTVDVLDLSEVFYWTGGAQIVTNTSANPSHGVIGICEKPQGFTHPVMVAFSRFAVGYVNGSNSGTDGGDAEVSGVITDAGPATGVEMGLCTESDYNTATFTINTSWSSYIAVEPAQAAGVFH